MHTARSHLVSQVERAVLDAIQHPDPADPHRPLSVYVQGLGKSGLAACSAIRQLGVEGHLGQRAVRILATDAAPAAVATEAACALADVRA